MMQYGTEPGGEAKEQVLRLFERATPGLKTELDPYSPSPSSGSNGTAGPSLPPSVDTAPAPRKTHVPRPVSA